MKQNKFKVIVPSYNNEEWYEYNIASILNQTYTNYDVLYIDDCSTDRTYEKVVEVVGDLPNWTVVKNPVNKRRGYNVSPYNPDIINFINDDDDILVFVDGDDWLFEDQTFEKLNQYYNDHDVWMTYGQYVNYPSLELGTSILHGTQYSNQVHSSKLYRLDVWRASHLRTFKWHLYSQIKRDDLLFGETNEHYIYAEDLATSFPCLEMAGPGKVGVVDFLTYVYNSSESNRERILNDLERDPNGYETEMKARESDIRSKQPYATIKPQGVVSSKLSGGLGNMLFQVAAGYSLAKKHGIEYKLYPEHSATLHNHPKQYLDTIFSKLPIVNSVDGFSTIREQQFEYSPLSLTNDRITLLDGHFQSYKYFEREVDSIRELFAPSQEMVEKLTNKFKPKDAVSLHVRRGDYTTLSQYHHNLSIDYYLNALDYFKSYRVLVFSDDIDWCKSSFKGDRFTFVEGQSDLEDLYLMSMCAHNITANSTFSWWGAMLNQNKNKQVVCPNKWFGSQNETLATYDLFPPEWICLPEVTPQMEVNLFDRSFSHLAKDNGRYSSVHGRIADHIKYTNGNLEHSGISLFTDQYLDNPIVDRIESAQKVGWLMESRQVDPTYYNSFETYVDRFDYVLTHDQELLDRYPTKTKLTVFGGCWIKPQNYGLHRKTKGTSMIYSSKQNLEGHRMRHKVAELAKGVDLYGNGSGKLIEYKEEALVDYGYSIIIENVKTQNYFTEKLIDSLVVGTIPIYWGCPNIGDFFDVDGMVIVDSIDDILKVLPLLDEEYYQSRLNNVVTNFKTAKQYATTEDWLYKNIFTTK
jgi:glycosyltransferase involved in cell wall biosynthesis